MRRYRVCILIPTYNNAGTLRRVIDDVLLYADDVIVVNDGSTDSTSEILDGFADRIVAVEYGKNRGKGDALVAGFRKAMELGFDYAITIDSDGQHYPSDIPAFVEAIAQHPDTLIVGERDLSGVDINGKSSFANKFSNFWFAVQTGLRLNDTQTGFRAYPLRRLSALSLTTSRYEAELEFMVFAAWSGVDIISIPIKVYYPPQSERISHFRPAKDFTRISILNTILCILAIVYGYPRMAVSAIRRKRLFGKEFSPFTRKDGKRRDAAVTLPRLWRSFYGFSFFIINSLLIFTPFAFIYFGIGRPSEKKKLRFHRMLRRVNSFIAYHLPGAKTVVDNPSHESFERPAVVACNHQSILDLPVIMSLSPKLIFLTNDRVWNSRVYGRIIRNAEFFPASHGVEKILPHLRSLRDRGYSIVIFPEGTRSADCRILRFHQGAFLLAKELGLDIVPMTLYGAGHVVAKNDILFRRGSISLHILPRISNSEISSLSGLKLASRFRALIRSEYDAMAKANATPAYFRHIVFYKYAYRGWRTVSRCKRILKDIERNDVFSDPRFCDRSRVRILDAGTGVFPLLYALMHPETRVYAYISRIDDFKIASGTASLPDNLHYINAIFPSDYETDEPFDLSIILGDDRSTAEYAGIDPDDESTIFI